jgi:hypothetical protein
VNKFETMHDKPAKAPELNPDRPRYGSPGRRGARNIAAAGSRWLHAVPATGPGAVTRRYRRAFAAILRTAPRLDTTVDDVPAAAKRLLGYIATKFAEALGGVEHVALASAIMAYSASAGNPILKPIFDALDEEVEP